MSLEVDIYSYLRQKGVSQAATMGIMANIYAESRFNPDAIGDNGTSGGLFQHHLTRWDSLKKFAAESGRSWNDWQAQVDFAIKEAQQMGADLQATDAKRFSEWWTTYWERPADAKTKAPQRASLVDRFNFENQLTGGGISAHGGMYYSTGSFDPSVEAKYDEFNRQIDLGLSSASALSKDAQSQLASLGLPAELEPWLWQYSLIGTDALYDPVIQDTLRLLAQRGMSDEEFAERLFQSPWTQSRTERQLQWDDITKAQQEQDIIDSASTLVGLLYTWAGTTLSLSEYAQGGALSSKSIKAGNPTLYSFAYALASGEKSQRQIIDEWLKPLAEADSESPWSQMMRTTEISRGKFEVDTETWAGQVMDLYQSMGVDMNWQQAVGVGNKLAMNQLSFAELTDQVDKMAQQLYGKPVGVSTMQWAAPYLQTYSTLMEEPSPGLSPEITSALQDGLSLSDFRRQIKANPSWKGTDNARDEYMERFSQVSRIFGF